MATLKYSRQRESIKENLMHRRDHPTADMIYTDIRKIYPNISLGTVYRNLALLSDLGEIRKLTVDGGADRFDGNISPPQPFHLPAVRGSAGSGHGRHQPDQTIRGAAVPWRH